MLRKWGFLIGALLLAAMTSAFVDGTQRTTLKLEGNVQDVGESDGQVWFTFWSVDQRFVIARAKSANADAALKALNDSNAQGRSVTVRYDPETAVIDLGAPYASYVARALVFDGKTIEGDVATPPRSDIASRPAWEQAEFALGRAVAFAGAGEHTTALRLLDQALRSSLLRTSLKALAFKTRSELIEDDGLSQWPAGDERDRALIAALQDSHAWQQLAPDDEHAAMATAWRLMELGAYDEALDSYQDVLKRWPDAAYGALRGMAAVHRASGNPALSLDDLSKLAALPGQAGTMPYRYHRGWTLEELGRWDEAIAEFTEGLKFQPDYDGAFWRRGCAYAATGQLRKALDDFRASLKYRNEYLESLPPSPGVEFDNKRYLAAEQTLAEALNEHPHQKIAGLCEGYWDWGDQPRQRSKLLQPKP